MPSKIQRTKQCHSLRIEYAGQGVNSFPLEPSDLLPGWHRDFEISDKTTLEQLSSTILQILAWDRDHLYEFRIGDRIHGYFGEDEQFVDAIAPFVSCDIPMHLLGLAPTDSFAYVFDFGDYHTFRVTVLDVQPLPSGKVFVYSIEPPRNTGLRRKDWTKAEFYSKVKCVFQGHQRGSSDPGVGAGTPEHARGARPSPA